MGIVVTAGLLGIGLFVIVVSGTFLILADRFTGGTGIAGLAAATTAGNAAAVPTLVAAANPAYATAAKPATVLITASVVVTAVTVPSHCLVGRTFRPIEGSSGMTECLILADDLSGAADSAVSALEAGLDAEVLLTPESAQESRTAVAGPDFATQMVDVGLA